MIAGRRILVGVTGGIAAFKTAELVSALVKDGAEVRAVMTRAARRFVGPATFEALTGYPVATELWLESGHVAPQDHIAYARWAELVVVAPATANFLAKLAHGIADDFLSTFLLVNRAPLLVAPAMNTDMLEHPAVQANLERARALGAQILSGAPGRLACGTEGVGRMAEPEELRQAIHDRLARGRDLAGRRVAVVAGRTEEPIDAVRYLSNRSSGKTGAELAREAAARGAHVVLVWGPADVPPPAGVEVRPVRTAAEMAEAARQAFRESEVVVMAAAVADFRPAAPAQGKLRRAEAGLHLEMESTPDILAGLGRDAERAGKLLVGFALETGGAPEDARGKLTAKGLDLLVWNDPTREDCGFGGDRNRVAILDAAGGSEELPLLPKSEIARRLWDRVVERLRGGSPRAGTRT